MTPSDPLFGIQAHFDLIGDIQTIWDEYDGSGVNVGVYDDGVDSLHEDLFANYNFALEVVNSAGRTVDADPVLISDAHGTAVAGLIAADDNIFGSVGVAHGASITGVNIFAEGVYGFINADTNAGLNAFLDVISQASNFDVMNNSWGGTPVFAAESSLVGSGFDASLTSEYEILSGAGRNGLGTIITQAAGNDDLDANGDGVNASRFTITVAATEANSGDAASFSNFGQSVLISAPAANVTTDLSGQDGYNFTGAPGELGNIDYTNNFGGTSAATPVISGVVSLMLDANDDLGWRDVQNILAMSASHTGSDLGGASTGNEDGAWFFNGADNWNGGGQHFHVNYGYGLVDAFSAVRMAEVWSLFDDAQVIGNEVRGFSSRYAPASSALVPEGGDSLTFDLTFSGDIDLEHVGLVIDLNTSYVGDLEITLTSAEGTRITVVSSDASIGTNVDGGWYFGIDSLLGEEANGTWTVSIKDNLAGDATRINNAELQFFGSAPTNNDTYHFTDEVMDLVTTDASRLALNDDNGGTDWLNFAALKAPGRLTVDLDTDGTGGASIADFGDISNIADGVTIEHAVGGDGNDLLIGNGVGNNLYGMRGHDKIMGGIGNDRLDGGQGRDELRGEQGADRLFGGAGNDRAYGGDGNDVFFGGSGTDRFLGGAGVDTGRGGTENDFFFFGLGNDRGYGDGGNDRLTGQGGNDALWGGNGKDILNGGDGTDTLRGQAGNDRLVGGAKNDKLYGGSDVDQLNAGSGSDLLSGGSGNDIMNGGSGNDRLFGESGNDRMVAGTGNDTINGGSGNDRMTGQGGNDRFVFTGSFGKDTITDFQSGSGIGDRIDFARVSAFGNFNQVISNSEDVGKNVVITINSSNKITLLNTSISDLAANDFIF